MTAAVLLSHPEQARLYMDSLERLLPEPMADGHEPESRVVHCGVSWDYYLAFDQALGDDRPAPRFYYLDRELEIMTTSTEHERLKMWLAGFMDLHFDEAGVEVTTRGQATMRSAWQQAGAEPDVSWCLHTEKEFPDLVLEIALTSGGVSKLELYRRFAVPEVWFWRRGKLEIFALRADGSAYEQLSEPVRSHLLPGLDPALLERCVSIPSWQQARRAFRAGMNAGK